MTKQNRRIIFLLAVFLGLALAWPVANGWAIPFPTIQFGIEDTDEPAKISSALQILILLTVLALAPSILIMTTAFSRIIIVLSFLRQAMGTQPTPPTQVL
ncbi:MAG: flagellar biosynthetic protein FliP, partial [Nitrospinae bacterium]|nr:flagellar biosynthetic protein FliP [Nitrospinota bacterium]